MANNLKIWKVNKIQVTELQQLQLQNIIPFLKQIVNTS